MSLSTWAAALELRARCEWEGMTIQSLWCVTRKEVGGYSGTVLAVTKEEGRPPTLAMFCCETEFCGGTEDTGCGVAHVSVTYLDAEEICAVEQAIRCFRDVSPRP